MFKPRIIPTLLLKNKGLVKSIKFKNHKYIGDPMNAIKIFNDFKVDELVFLDIEATKNNRVISKDFVKKISYEANMPFAVGGGIKSNNDIRSVINNGAEKVVISSEAILNPKFISKASEEFGSSSIVVCMDVKKNIFGNKYRVFVNNGKTKTHYDPVELSQMLEDKGAGEIIINSINNDGMMQGYDMEIAKKISLSVSIPVISLGGAGNLDHMKSIYQEGYVSAMAAGSMFVYHGNRNAVLINYPLDGDMTDLFNID